MPNPILVARRPKLLQGHQVTERSISDWLKALHDISKAISSSLDAAAVEEVILNESASMMRTSQVVLFLLTADGGGLEIRSARGIDVAGLAGQCLNVVGSFDHCIVHKGAVIRLDELLAASDTERCRQLQPRLLDMFFAPLEVQGAAYGLLGVAGQPHEFSFEELEMFCLLASQAGVALENAGLYQQLRTAYAETTGALAKAINSRDPYTGGHIERVRDDALLLGDALGLTQQEGETLGIGATLHDIGKIGIDDRILRKKAALTLAEQAQMRQHPEIGARILVGVEGLAAVAAAVRHHHEWFDGSGYPDGLAGEAIPLHARIIAIADAYDALTTDRPYHPAATVQLALTALQAAAGTQFDPVLVATFVQLMSHRGPRPAGPA